MYRYKTLTALLATVILGVLIVGVPFADEPPKAVDPAALTIIDSNGKEHKLKSWKFSQGTRHLAWLAPAVPMEKEPEAKDDKDDQDPPPKKPRPKFARPVAGPEALEFREENSTNWEKGVLTFILLDRLRSLEFDAEKELATAKVATSDKAEADETLTGVTRFKGINKITIEAEVDKGGLGVAELKFIGGTAKGIRGLRFANPKPPAAAAAGRPAAVTVADKMNKNAMRVSDLQALYRFPNGSEKLLPLLMFKKTLKVDIGQVKKIVAGDGDGTDVVWTVSLKDGNEENLTLLQTIQLEGKDAMLEGLLGRVAGGYKLFPPHTIAELEFDAAKEPVKDPGTDK
jgi:hypothetical protein